MGQRSSTPVDAVAGLEEPLGRLRAALDASCVVGTWDWDIVRDTMVYDAGAAQLLTGDASQAERELSGLGTIAAVHPADHAWLIDHVQTAVRAGGLMLAEYRVVAADGAVRWLLSRGRTYHDGAARPVRSRGVIIDITEMRGGGARYVVRDPEMPEGPLDHAVDLALALRRTLGPEAPEDARAAMDLLLFALGRALARADDGR